MKTLCYLDKCQQKFVYNSSKRNQTNSGRISQNHNQLIQQRMNLLNQTAPNFSTLIIKGYLLKQAPSINTETQRTKRKETNFTEFFSLRNRQKDENVQFKKNVRNSFIFLVIYTKMPRVK